MTKYLVHLNYSLSQVVISLDGYGPTASDGLSKIGEFELDIDPNDGQMLEKTDLIDGPDHPFINEARKVLQDHLGGHNSTQGFTFVDKATNAVPEADDAMTHSTDDLAVTEGTNSNPDVSTQAGGEVNSQTNERRAGVQQDGGKTDLTPGQDLAQEENQEAGDETVVALKERIGKITDKDELEKAYKAEQEGKNRPTAIAAIEARAKELED